MENKLVSIISFILRNFYDRNGGIDTSDMLNFIFRFFITTKDTGSINDVVLILAVLLLVIALSISIYISKRHNLYISQRKEDLQFQLLREDEVA
jgi:hypothetical protein